MHASERSWRCAKSKIHWFSYVSQSFRQLCRRNDRYLCFWMFYMANCHTNRHYKFHIWDSSHLVHRWQWNTFYAILFVITQYSFVSSKFQCKYFTCMSIRCCWCCRCFDEFDWKTCLKGRSLLNSRYKSLPYTNANIHCIYGYALHRTAPNRTIHRNYEIKTWTSIKSHYLTNWSLIVHRVSTL